MNYGCGTSGRNKRSREIAMFYSTVEVAGVSNHTVVALLVYMVVTALASYRYLPTLVTFIKLLRYLHI